MYVSFRSVVACDDSDTFAFIGSLLSTCKFEPEVAVFAGSGSNFVERISTSRYSQGTLSVFDTELINNEAQVPWMCECDSLGPCE